MACDLSVFSSSICQCPSLKPCPRWWDWAREQWLWLCSLLCVGVCPETTQPATIWPCVNHLIPLGFRFFMCGSLCPHCNLLRLASPCLLDICLLHRTVLCEAVLFTLEPCSVPGTGQLLNLPHGNNYTLSSSFTGLQCKANEKIHVAVLCHAEKDAYQQTLHLLSKKVILLLCLGMQNSQTFYSWIYSGAHSFFVD